MSLTKELVLSNIANFCEFSKIFNKCSEKLQNTLLELIIKGSQYSCNKNDYIKNMKETSVRFQKPYSEGRRSQNYCMFSLQSGLNRIIVDFRTDGTMINSEILQIKNIGNAYSGGFEWHRIILQSEKEVDEVVRLISKCYEG